MAVALKSRSFRNTNDLCAFCQNAANNVTSVHTIYQDTSDIWWLFYT